MNTSEAHELFGQLMPAFFLWTIPGALGCLSNFMLVLMCFKDSSLQTASHFLIQQKAFANCIACGYFVFYGIECFVKLYQKDFYLERNYHCVLKIGLHICCVTVNTVMMLNVALDRYLGICFPGVYLLLPKWIYYACTILAWVCGLIHFSIAFLYSNNNLTILCIPPTAFIADSFLIWNNSFLVLNVLVLSIYLLTIFKATKTMNKLKNTVELPPRFNLNVMRRHLKSLRSLTLIVGVYILTWVSTGIILKISTLIDPEEKSLFVVYGYVGFLAVCDVCSDFPILVWRGSDYRRGARRLLIKQSPLRTYVDETSSSESIRFLHNSRAMTLPTKASSQLLVDISTNM